MRYLCNVEAEPITVSRIVRSAEAESTARVSNDKLFQDLRKREISLANVKSKHAA